MQGVWKDFNVFITTVRKSDLRYREETFEATYIQMQRNGEKKKEKPQPLVFTCKWNQWLVPASNLSKANKPPQFCPVSWLILLESCVVLFPLQQHLTHRKVKNAIWGAPTGTSHGFNSNHWKFRIKASRCLVRHTMCPIPIRNIIFNTFISFLSFLLHFIDFWEICYVLSLGLPQTLATSPTLSSLCAHNWDSICQRLSNTKSPFKGFVWGLLSLHHQLEAWSYPSELYWQQDWAPDEIVSLTRVRLYC